MVRPTRLESMVRGHMKKGFSRTVAQKVVEPQKDSTLQLYQSRWFNFVSWCMSMNIDPCQSTEIQMADFLIFLREEKGLAFPTLTGYTTAVASVVKIYTGLDLAKSQPLIALTKSLCKDTTKGVLIPGWDLSVVLKALKEPPFEPINQCKLSMLSYKSIFLLTLALGARRSEIHALTVLNMKVGPENQYIQFFPHLSFIPKTRAAHSGPE